MKKECPLVSVIIPCYNSEHYVERAIQSVLDQPYSNRLEVVVVNDGSTDGSRELLDKIACETIPELCAYSSYNFSLTFFESEKDYFIITDYKKYNLAPKLDKRVATFLKHPFMYWLCCKIFVLPKMKIKRLLYAKPSFRRIFDYIYYRIIKNYQLAE